MSVALCMGATVANAQDLGDLLKGLGNGMCVGFKMKYTGAAPASGSPANGAAVDSIYNAGKSPASGQSESVSNGVNALRNLLNKKKK